MKNIAVAFLLAALVQQGLTATSCVGRCGEDDHTDGCQCNYLCEQYGDCCSDYSDVCMTCEGRCGEAYDHAKPCQCNSDCPSHSNCCVDYNDLCGGGSGGDLTDADIEAFTEELYSLDVNNVASLLTFDIQGSTTSSDNVDQAPNKFFTSVPAEALQGPTVQAFLALRDNYVPSVSVTEDETPEELDENEAFLDAIMNTAIMNRTEEFLVEYNLISNTLKDTLRTMWFGLYARAAQSSCGLEHVMVGEIKNNKVSGFHNWISFYEEEDKGTLDYKGHMDIVDLGDKGIVLTEQLDWMDYHKAIGSMFVGTSPELELASFTVCFFARPSGNCNVQMNNQKFTIVTYPMDGIYVGTAYPDA